MAEQDEVCVDADKGEETVAGKPSFVTNNFHAPIDISIRVVINLTSDTGSRSTNPFEAFVERNPLVGGVAGMPLDIVDLIAAIRGSDRSGHGCGDPDCPVCSSGTQTTTVSDSEAAVAGGNDPVL